MMSEPTTVDGTTVDELTGKLVLLIEETRAWDQLALMHRQLAAKVKNYVRHVRGEEYGQPPSETIVRLVSEHRPGPSSIEFFSRVSYELSKHDVAFEYQVGDEGVPVPIPPQAEAAVPPEPARETRARGRPAASAPDISGPDTGPESPGRAEVEPVAERMDPTLEAEQESAGRSAREPLAEPMGPTFEAEEESAAQQTGTPDTPTTEKEVAAEEEVAAEYSPFEAEEAPHLTIERAEESDWKSKGVRTGSPEFQTPEEVEELISRLESRARPASDRPKYPPFFPEEEFGRAVPEMEGAGDESDEIEFIEPDFDTPVIAAGAGKRIGVDSSARDAASTSVAKEAQPRPIRALVSALGSALAGALLWGSLAIPADQGASPLALAVALMVGMSVRVRGGRSFAFRLVAGAATLFGSALGALLAVATLTAKHGGGVSALSALIEPAALTAAVTTYFGPLDLAFVAVALYIAMRISVAKS